MLSSLLYNVAYVTLVVRASLFRKLIVKELIFPHYTDRLLIHMKSYELVSNCSWQMRSLHWRGLLLHWPCSDFVTPVKIQRLFNKFILRILTYISLQLENVFSLCSVQSDISYPFISANTRQEALGGKK